MENLRILFGFSYHSHNLTCPASQGTATVGSRKLSATPDMSIQQLSQISWSFNGYKNRLFLAFSDMPCCWWMWVYDGLSMFIHWIPVKWRWILASKVAIPHPNDDPSTDQIVSWRERHQAPHEKAQRSSHRPAPKFAPIVSSGSISQTKVTSNQEGNIKSGSTHPLRSPSEKKNGRFLHNMKMSRIPGNHLHGIPLSHPYIQHHLWSYLNATSHGWSLSRWSFKSHYPLE